MTREFDLFERFPDGSSLWRGCVIGLENTRHHLELLARKSKNRFYAIDVSAGKIHRLEPGHETFALHAAKGMEKRRSATVG